MDGGRGMPTLIGEIGIAMDLGGGAAFLPVDNPAAPLAPGAQRHVFDTHARAQL